MNANKRNKWLWSGALALAIAAAGCYEPTAGCLDIEAVNYDFTADEDVREDCVYPALRLQFEHVYSRPDTLLPFRPRDTFYLDAAGHPFRIQAFSFYLSKLQLVDAQGGLLDVEDELEIFVPNPGGPPLPRTIPDNYAIVLTGNSSSINIGTLRDVGALQGLQFFVGVEGVANIAVVDSLPSRHPLSPDEEFYFSPDSGYVFQYIELFRDTVSTDTVPEVLRIGTFPYVRLIELPISGEKIEGLHFRIVLQVDYRRWLEGLDVRNDSREQLMEKIVGNTTNAFSVKEVVQEVR